MVLVLLGSTIHKSRLISLKYTRFEKARIIGARSLQISMGAPTLISLSKDVIFPIDIAMLEFNEEAIPITVKRERT